MSSVERAETVRKRAVAPPVTSAGSPWPSPSAFSSAITQAAVPYQYSSASEYADAVRLWLLSYRLWCVSRYFPFSFLPFPRSTAAATPPPAEVEPAVVSSGVQPQTDGIRFKIPSLFKRVLAEFVDFICCFMISLMITFVLLSFELIHLEDYEKLLGNGGDLKLFIELTQKLLPIEITKKLVISIVEALSLTYGFGVVPPGCTPGKFFVNIRVINTDALVPVSAEDGSHVIVVGSSKRIPLFRSLIRSVTKNFALGFLFPACVTMYAFRYNRALYDICSSTIVVEM